MSEKPKQYPINTLAEMAAIPPEAWDRLAAELPSILAHVAMQRELSAAMAAISGDSEAGIHIQGVNWIDDGQKNVSHTLNVRNGGGKHTPPTVGDRP